MLQEKDDADLLAEQGQEAHRRSKSWRSDEPAVDPMQASFVANPQRRSDIYINQGGFRLFWEDLSESLEDLDDGAESGFSTDISDNDHHYPWCLE